jgi:hypothetical protein
MTDSRSPVPIFGTKAAAILGAVFVALYALFALLGAADRAQRSRLETLKPLPIEAHTHAPAR